MSLLNLSLLPSLLVTYLGSPRVSSQRAPALAAQLVANAPADADAGERRWLDEILARARAIDVILVAKNRAPSTLGVSRIALVTAWAALEAVLAAYAGLPLVVSPHGPTAQRILDLLRTGLVPFVQLDGAEAWAQANRVLGRISSEGLRASIDGIGAGVFVDHLGHAAGELRAAIGAASPTEGEPSAHALLEARARFRFAVSAYARTLSTKVDESDAASVERFLKALAPLEALRTTAASDDDDDEVGAPTPTPSEPVTPFTG